MGLPVKKKVIKKVNEMFIKFNKCEDIVDYDYSDDKYFEMAKAIQKLFSRKFQEDLLYHIVGILAHARQKFPEIVRIVDNIIQKNVEAGRLSKNFKYPLAPSRLVLEIYLMLYLEKTWSNSLSIDGQTKAFKEFFPQIPELFAGPPGSLEHTLRKVINIKGYTGSYDDTLESTPFLLIEKFSTYYYENHAYSNSYKELRINLAQSGIVDELLKILADSIWPEINTKQAVKALALEYLLPIFYEESMYTDTDLYYNLEELAYNVDKDTVDSVEFYFGMTKELLASYSITQWNECLPRKALEAGNPKPENPGLTNAKKSLMEKILEEESRASSDSNEEESLKKESTIEEESRASSTIIEDNQDALLKAVNLELGNTTLTVTKEFLKKNKKSLPKDLNDLLKSPMSDLTISNILSMVAEQTQNEKLCKLAAATQAAAFQSLISKINITGFITNLINPEQE
jgi:hypothetical protein